MRCVFVLNPFVFSVQFHSPLAVERYAQDWQMACPEFEDRFSVYEGVPVEYRHGATAVLLPKEFGKAQRKALYKRFLELNPSLGAASGTT